MELKGEGGSVCEEPDRGLEDRAPIIPEQLATSASPSALLMPRMGPEKSL